MPAELKTHLAVGMRDPLGKLILGHLGCMALPSHDPQGPWSCQSHHDLRTGGRWDGNVGSRGLEGVWRTIGEGWARTAMDRKVCEGGFTSRGHRAQVDQAEVLEGGSEGDASKTHHISRVRIPRCRQLPSD